jgi:hypothetical protein
MKKILFTFSIVFVLAFSSFSQSTTITPGSILPSMTTVQRTAVVSPPDGMLVFDNTIQSYWFRQSGVWVELPKAGSTSNYWELNGLNGNEIKNTNSGGFWSANPTTLPNYDPTGITKTTPMQGNGTRLMWIPSMSAFRVGTINDGQKSWDKDSIGVHSVGLGLNTKASGYFTTATGLYTTASGEASTSMGYGGVASGFSSTVMGTYSTAKAVGGTSLGQYNENTDLPDGAVRSTDRIFQIGNGNSINSRKNAMTVLRNAYTGVNTANPQAMLHVNGFTKLGDDAPKVKLKKLTGTTSSTEGGSVFINHGIGNGDKILQVSIEVERTNGAWYANGYTGESGYIFDYFYGDSFLYITNKVGNSSNILSRPLKALIVYEE